MAGTKISTLYNANVYMGGDSYAGQGQEVTLPNPKPKLAEHKPLSGIGAFDLTTGLDKMNMKVKWNSIDADVMKIAANFYSSNDIMIRANSDVWENGSRTGSVPVVAIIRGLSINLPAIVLKHQDNPDIETEFNVTAYKLIIDNEVIFDIDLFAQIYIVDGVDLMAEYRSNLGI
jgi:hypothetical protein